jgi:hypothetical protein
MSQALRHPLTDLPRGSTLRLADGQPRVIDVFQGQVWITQDGDPRDVILEAGESFRIEGRGLTLLQAFADSRVLVTELTETSSTMNAVALHRLARAQRDAAVAAWICRGMAAVEAGVYRLLDRLMQRPLRPSSAPA